MKLGEIKIEALKLMFVSETTDFYIETLEHLALDEDYNVYLANMPGSINRCFSNIEEKGVLPSKCTELDPAKAVESGYYLRFDLGEIGDFLKVDRIVRESDAGDYDSNCSYHREGNILVLPRITEYEKYTLIYKPKLARVTSGTDNATELPIPENIAVHIPYFIKGDLYRDDEPNEASEARNWFEAAMGEIAAMSDREANITGVRSIYSQTEC